VKRLLAAAVAVLALAAGATLASGATGVPIRKDGSGATGVPIREDGSSTGPGPGPGRLPREPRRDTSLPDLVSRYEALLAIHRPDLAQRYALPARSVPFVPLNEATIDKHAAELRFLLAAVDSIGHGDGARADTLRARIARELDETAAGGALRRDALLWLDIVAAAASTPFESGPALGCDRTHRAALHLSAVPEALRGAAVLMHGANPPDPQVFESRLASLEGLLRRDLPARTDACKEGRRLAEFAEADTLAAASLNVFRRSLALGH